MKALMVGLAFFSVTAAITMACTGEDPVFVSDAGATSVAPEGGSGACDARDKTPCGCGPAQGCCIGYGVVKCVSAGTGTPADGCESTTTLDCMGSTCGGTEVCCFNGKVSMGAMCAKRASAFDTRCVPAETRAGVAQCTDTSNGALHELTCEIDDDCARYDAGTCVSALMDTVNRVIGVCVR